MNISLAIIVIIIVIAQPSSPVWSSSTLCRFHFITQTWQHNWCEENKCCVDAQTVAFFGAATIYRGLTRARGGIWTVATGVWEEAVDATNVQAHVRRMAADGTGADPPRHPWPTYRVYCSVSCWSQLGSHRSVFARLDCSIVKMGPGHF